MAEKYLSGKSQVRPALDPGAPWAANAAKQSRNDSGDRYVVYCITVEGLELLKVGRTKQLKKRLASLQRETGKSLHISYWAEFSRSQSKDVERCALIRLRGQFPSEGEWSLASPMFGAAAIRSASEFLGLRPAYEAGAPTDEEPVEEYALLRENKTSVRRKAKDRVDRDYWENPFTVNLG